VSLVARLDGLTNATTGATEEPLPWQPQPRGSSVAAAAPTDGPRSEASDQAASLATESGGDGGECTHVEVDAVGSTRLDD